MLLKLNLRTMLAASTFGLVIIVGVECKNKLIKTSLQVARDFHIYEYPDVAKRSCSPWTYKIDQGSRRIPEIIHVAKCQHQGCIGQNGKEDLTFYSLPIKRKMIFLHKVKKGFKMKMKTVSVGCTCVRPHVQN
ncbi:interleukin-17F-like [Polypterus senegalus]